MTGLKLKAAVVIGSEFDLQSGRTGIWAERSEACRNLTKNYQEILIRPDFSEWRQNWTSEIEEDLRYKTAQKAGKSEQKS